MFVWRWHKTIYIVELCPAEYGHGFEVKANECWLMVPPQTWDCE